MDIRLPSDTSPDLCMNQQTGLKNKVRIITLVVLTGCVTKQTLIHENGAVERDEQGKGTVIY